ncbi:small basic protein [Natronobacillus azotifigens]|uniref:Small basic family protein n=1 Tax=Natronobacillus azotifigens TaxID=472978 RepID=A0A9J6RD99_9BACI|nr:small basic family protein [Natronobacillus azotifigens]MCZ0703342.1 small basic family protein [Natronobacillus azotifigens]
MWLPVLFLVVGIALGFLTDFTIAEQYTKYLSIAILAAFDTLFGGIRAHFEKTFDQMIFISGFFFNITLAVILTFIGVQLGVDLYLAAVFALGLRVFQNIATIRRHIFQYRKQINQKKFPF